MASFNKIILVGNLTRDPQLSYLPSQTAVCEFGIATNHKWKDKDGNTHEDVCFVDCAIYGRGAEIFKQYMSKGRPALIEGRLKLDQWTTPEGDKRSKHRVFVDNFQFLGGQGQGQGGDGAPQARSQYGGGRSSAGQAGPPRTAQSDAQTNYAPAPAEEPVYDAPAPTGGGPGDVPF